MKRMSLHHFNFRCPMTYAIALSCLFACACGSVTLSPINTPKPIPNDSRGAAFAALKAQALQAGLAQKKQWLRLGHWLPAKTGKGYQSEVDGAGFFLSPYGKQHPEAELIATLAAFMFGTTEPSTELPPEHPALQNPVCRFPARFAFILKELKPDPSLSKSSNALPLRSFCKRWILSQ
ncbi:MAG: hypothetical protein IPJ88_10205 [Myxococcales bacterium]|nr:MAG: hypothetical protein IPJ88_10205 [Myxococcales bacterium]